MDAPGPDVADTAARRRRITGVGLSRRDSARIVQAILGHMRDALARGENVKIVGFGSFILRDKNQRMGRNLNNGAEMPIPARRVLTFRAGIQMRERIAGAAPRPDSPDAARATG